MTWNIEAVLAAIALLGAFTAWMARMYHLVKSTHDQLPKLWEKVDANEKHGQKLDVRVTRLEARQDWDTEMEID